MSWKASTIHNSVLIPSHHQCLRVSLRAMLRGRTSSNALDTLNALVLCDYFAYYCTVWDPCWGRPGSFFCHARLSTSSQCSILTEKLKMHNIALHLLKAAWHEWMKIPPLFHESRELSALAGRTLKIRAKAVVSLLNPKQFFRGKDFLYFTRLVQWQSRGRNWKVQLDFFSWGEKVTLNYWW